MLVFPPAWTPSPPFTLTDSGRQVGYIPRVRRRIPVFLAEGDVQAFPPLLDLPVIALLPTTDGDIAPGAALLHGGSVAYASSINRREEEIQDVLRKAERLSSAAPLVVWDAASWEEDLLRFRRSGAAEAAPSDLLASRPVYCLRSALEHRDLDPLTVGHAAIMCGLVEPGPGALAVAFTLAGIRDWVAGHRGAAPSPL